MSPILQIIGPEHTVQFFGIKLLGINAENGRKFLLTIIFVVVVLLLSKLLKGLARGVLGKRRGRIHFWTRQTIHMVVTAVLVIGLISIWFSDPGRLASAAALVTAGLAIASQRIITAFAGYFIILRGKNFSVGDRIVMAGVRGDVISVGFMQTSIMEMGQPPPEQGDAPSMWVAARQYTGRIVTITNDNIFEKPVYNYTREFPFIWEEMRLPIPYNADRRAAEQIILDAARRHTTKIADLSEEALQELEKRYVIKREELEPHVFFRLTDNWVEMAVRFVTKDHGIRAVKDAMSRQILDGLDAAKIGIASGAYEVVGMPELKVRVTNTDGAR